MSSLKLNVDLIHPVGSIYLSVNSTSPATIWGGTWERIQGRFLWCGIDGDVDYGVGGEGGEYKHQLIISEMPKHSHNARTIWPFQAGSGYTGIPNSNATSYHGEEWGTIVETGGDRPHNNMPPWLGVYAWKRTA